MKMILNKTYDVLDLIAEGIAYGGTTAANMQRFVIEIPKNVAAQVMPEGLVTAIENIRDELGIEKNREAITPPDERLDPAARLLQQMMTVNPTKAASISKIKTNGSSTEVTFATSITSMEVTPVERTAECKDDGTVSTT
jgi:hypothetical protein